MSFTAGVMSSCWLLDGAMRAGGRSRRRDESSHSKEGVVVTMADGQQMA